MGDPSQYQTRWSLIALARKGQEHQQVAARALDELCLRYRPAILAAIRRSGVPADDCEDVCQVFMGQIFIERAVAIADPSKGRFRTFLLHLVRSSIVDWQRKGLAQKRGRGKIISMDAQDESVEGQMSEFDIPSAELDFEMDFAQQIHEGVLSELRQDYAGRGQTEAFDLLAPHLLTKQDEGVYGTLAETLGMPSATVRQILSRLRKRYGRLFREQVLETVTDERDLDDELRNLLKLLLAARLRSSKTDRDRPKSPP